MEQKQPLQQMGLGDLDCYLQKNEIQSPTYAIHKYKFKVDKSLKYKTIVIPLKPYRTTLAEKSQTFHAAASSQTCPLKQGT